LRATRRAERRGEIVQLSACDPLNLVGIITPGPRIQATLANSVVYVDGVPQPAAQNGADTAARRAWPVSAQTL
jgi:hypothetical protein